jgi:hypothetical protein
MLTVDALAQEIRRVDGSKSLGAGALAEALMPFVSRAPSPSPAPGVVEALPENVLEDAAKAAFIKAQSVYRGLHDHLPLKNTWETLTESIRDGWRAIAHAALEAAYMPPLGTQPEPRLPRDVPSALASISQPAKGEQP